MAQVLSAFDPQSIHRAAAIIRKGGLVAFPTETVYGLGADAFNARATARVFEVKQRPSFDPLIVHIAEPDELELLVEQVDIGISVLTDRFWPGPLTLVLSKKDSVPDIVTAGLDTVAVRMPRHSATLALIRAAGTPIVGPSANPFGYVSPTTAEHVVEHLGEHVDIILDGGPCTVGVESTIISLATNPPRLLRPGGVPVEDIEAVVGPVDRSNQVCIRPDAPGQLRQHYATRTPLYLLKQPGETPAIAPGERVGLLAFSPPPDTKPYVTVEALAPDGNLITAASNLFGALRRLDVLGLDRLYAEPCAETGIGAAIMDRLRRCAAAQE